MRLRPVMGIGMETQWVEIGRLIRTRGNRGELIGELDSREPGRETKLQEVRLERNGRSLLVRVEEVWWHAGRPVFRLAGIDSISSAELWEGAAIQVPAAELTAPGEGEYSHAGLVGCEVVVLGTGSPVGRVKGVQEYGGPPLLEVETAEGREVLIPFARSICRKIDPAAKVIAVELPEGLLEL